MISDQLRKIKKVKYYTFSEDLDIESLLELIPSQIPRTKYLSKTTIHFDRQRLTYHEEGYFNKKFKKWMKSLVIYNKIEGYEYLLDFLIKKYLVHKFNVKELCFLTLCNKKWYTYDLDIFPYLSRQRAWSKEFFAECCASHIEFFEFIIDYYDYFKYLNEFLNDIMHYFINKNHNRMHNYRNQLEDILERLNENNIVAENESDCEDIKKRKCNKNIVDMNIRKQNILNAFSECLNFQCKKINAPVKILKNQDPHKQIYDEKTGRKLFADKSSLRSYVMWLHKNNLKDESFTDNEMHLLFSAYCSTEFKIDSESSVSDYKNLVKETYHKSTVLRVLYKYFEDKIFEKQYNLFEEEEFEIYDFYKKSTILEIINKKNWKQSPIKDKDILLLCLHFSTFDPAFFDNCKILFDKTELNELYQRSPLFVTNLLEYCKWNNIPTDCPINKAQGTSKIEYDIRNLIEGDIISHTSYKLVIDYYKVNKSIIKEIRDYKLVNVLCEYYGYKEILDSYDLDFICEMHKINDINMESDYDYIKYVIDRFDIKDILSILKDSYKILICFVEHPKFAELKNVIKEFLQTPEDVKFLLDKIFISKAINMEDVIDLIFLYKKEYNFINEYKENILEYIKKITGRYSIGNIVHASSKKVSEKSKGTFVLFIDFLLLETDYEDIRIINYVSRMLIENYKKSILRLFDLYGNIMSMYLDLFIRVFPVIEDLSLLKLDNNLLIQKIVKYNKISEYNFILINILKGTYDIDIDCLCKEDICINIVYYILYYLCNNKDINQDKYKSLINRLIEEDNDRAMHFCKYYNQDIKNVLFNKILEEKKYNLCNKYFKTFEVEETRIYALIGEYYEGNITAKSLSYLSNNIKNIKKFNELILKRCDSEFVKPTLDLIRNLLDHNDQYGICYNSIRREVILCMTSQDKEIRNLCIIISDKLDK